MARQKIYALCIGVEKLGQLISGRSTVVSRKSSCRWESFYNKKLKKVRFFDINMLKEGTFTVKHVEKTSQMGEMIIRIEIGKKIKQ